MLGIHLTSACEGFYDADEDKSAQSLYTTLLTTD